MPTLLHTADWHLGKRLHDFWLLDQQREALERLMDVIADERPDLVVVAGDVFDAPIPPIRALQSWEWAVDRIVEDLGVPLLVIPGNHDHAERIAMNARLARHSGLHMRTDLTACRQPVRVAGTDVFAVPFHKPPHVRALMNREGVGDADVLGDFDYDAAMGWLLDRARAHRDPDVPAVLVAHAFVDGAGEEPEGEDSVMVGGVGGVRPATFHGFDYVALGHIHGPRTLNGPVPVRYCGSLYPYAFGEPNAKSVTLVDLPADRGEGTAAEIREVPLHASRRVRVLEGLSFDEVLARGRASRAARNVQRAVAASADPDGALPADARSTAGASGIDGHTDADAGDGPPVAPAADAPGPAGAPGPGASGPAASAAQEDPDDYILARVTDTAPIDHALARLREVHPNALLDQGSIDVQGAAHRLEADARTIRVEDAFLKFYDNVFGQAPSPLEAEILRQVLAGDDPVPAGDEEPS